MVRSWELPKREKKNEVMARLDELATEYPVLLATSRKVY